MKQFRTVNSSKSDATVNVTSGADDAHAYDALAVVDREHDSPATYSGRSPTCGVGQRLCVRTVRVSCNLVKARKYALLSPAI